MDEREILELNMSRYDNYIEKADNKASFILALTGVLLGGLVFQSNDILNIIHNNILKKVTIFNLMGISILLIVSSFLALKVILPSTSKSTVKSIFYFNDIVEYTEEEYKKKLQEINNEKAIDDLRRQVLQLGNICTIKMNSIKLSLQFLLATGILIIIQLLIIFISLY